MDKILVAVDGSKYSDKALLKAKEIATAMGSEVTILTVLDLYKDATRLQQKSMKEVYKDIAYKEGNEVLDKAVELFNDFEGTLHVTYQVGDPVDEITKYAEAKDFDLIILGSRGLGVFSRALLGSVSDKVVHHIKKSVLIVK